MTCTLNSATIANVTGCTRTVEFVGTMVRMGDGSLKTGTTRVTPVAYVWTVECKALTAAELGVIVTPFNASIKAYKTFVPPDGSSFNVRSIPNSWREKLYWGDGVWKYDLTFQLAQADPT